MTSHINAQPADKKHLSWEDARAQIRKDGKKDKVSKVLAEEIRQMGTDQKVTFQDGTCAWDFAEAVKQLNPNGKEVKGKTVEQLSNEFLKQMKISDPTKVPTGATLDLNTYLHEMDGINYQYV